MTAFFSSSNLLIVLFLAITAGARAQTDTITYSLIQNGNLVGMYKKWPTGNNEWQERYRINDRGRGDSLNVYFRETDKGIITELRISGHDYLKAPVSETFRLENGTATWKNDTEDISVPVDTPAYYVPLLGLGGNTLKALLKHDGKLKLLPSGQLSLRIIAEHEFTLDGKPIRLQLYETRGLGLTPTFGWMDEAQEDFAFVNNWFTIIREGFEALREDLLPIQRSYQDEFYHRLATAHVDTPAELLLRNVTYFDARRGILLPGRHILIRNGTITAISDRPLPESGIETVIDGTGLTLLPGLIDMHVHLSTNLAALQHIANGITSVRDLGNSFAILDLKKKIDEHHIVGPSFDGLAGLLDGAGPYAGPTPALANSAEEAVAWVDSFATKGYSQIKIYSSVQPDWVPAIAERARQRGLRVSGHIPAFMTAEKAIEQGFQEIQHMNMIFLNFYGDTVDTRTPQRFTLPARLAGDFDFDGPALSAFISLLREKEVVVDPTLNLFETLFTSRPGKMNALIAPLYDRLPLEYQRYAKAGGNGLPVTPETDARHVAAFDAFLRMTRVLHDNGVQIVAGTDSWAGFSLHRELELYVQAGIPAAEVLTLATLSAARILGKDAEIGSIEVGKRANLIFVEGNPLDNISEIRKVKTVIKDGRVYDAIELLNSISIRSYAH